MLFRRLLATLSLALVAATVCATGFEALTFGLSESWTGNGYVPTPNDPDGIYDFDVTGSEPLPIDPFASVGARFALVGSRAVLTVSPGLELGARRYVLFESGRVAPAQIETATGAEGSTLGRGSARIVTLRVPVPLGFEYRFGTNAIVASVSPTGVVRIPGGRVARRDEETDLSALYTYFYAEMRYLMPEASLGYRFAMSDALEATVHATWGVSVLDMNDGTLPWYDQMRVAVGFNLGIRPPFSGLARERERVLPEGIDPFPDDEN